MIERLPTPWGLVRSGVAPDHPKIKSVTRVYEKTAGHPRFRYFGNVTFGEHVSREELLAHYHAIVYATGSPSDRPLGHPRRRPARLPRGHRVRRLVQRPPRPHRPRGRPAVSRARGGDRQRQRRPRRRAHARARAVRARAHRHRRPRSGGASREPASREVVVARAPRTRPGRVHEPRAARARRARRRRRDRRQRELERGARGRRPGRRGRTSPPGATSRSCAPTPTAPPVGHAQAHRSALPALASGALARRARAPRRGRAGPQRARRRRPEAGCARSRPASARRSTPGSCSARSATAASRCRACRSTSAPP